MTARARSFLFIAAWLALWVCFLAVVLALAPWIDSL